jgi:haloalkane dehalogenase
MNTNWPPPHVRPFRKFEIETDDSRLAVTDAGSGPVLLFVHVGTWSFIWRELVARLAPHFRCIFFDAPGTGETVDLLPRPATMERASRAVGSVINALNLQDFTLVAHDLGGPSALAAVAATPKRVRGIIGMNAFAWRPSGAAFQGMLTLMGSPLIREIDVLTGFLPRLASTAFGVGLHLDDAARSEFRERMDTRGRRSFHDYIRDARRCGDLYERVGRALTGSLGRVPLLTIFGERNDPFGFQARWKELFPQARQVVVARGNHFPMCDAPDFVAQTIVEWHDLRIAECARVS